MDDNKINPRKTVKEQSNFISLLLEAAELIEKEEQDKKQKSKSNNNISNNNNDTQSSIQNVNELLSNLRSIFNSTRKSLYNPISLDNLAQLSSVLTFGTAAISASNINNSSLFNLNFNEALNNNKNNTMPLNLSGNESNNHYINITNITDINSVPIPSKQSSMKITNNTYKTNNNISSNNHRIMPNISIKPNLPSIKPQILPISSTNPLIALPSMPLPPSPPKQLNKNNNNKHKSSKGNNHGLNSLLNLLNAPSSINPINIMDINRNGKDEKCDNDNSVISKNILSALPRLMVNDKIQFTKSINNI